MRKTLIAALRHWRLALGACGDDDRQRWQQPTAARRRAETLTIYSSLPLQGAARTQSVAAVNGAKLALEQAGGKAGKFPIKYESLDDSTAQQGGWEPSVTSANALKVAGDDSTIGYIGEFNSGATAVSLPILNEAGIAQVSPGNTAVGITSDDPGSRPGEPDKYYPTGKRTYARVLPKDTYQGAALVALAKEQGCASAYILNDKEVYGAGPRHATSSSRPRRSGWRSRATTASTRPPPTTARSAQKIKAPAPHCFIYSGITANNAVQIFKDMAVALPDAPLLGPEGVGETGFFDPKEGGLPGRRRRRAC